MPDQESIDEKSSVELKWKRILTESPLIVGVDKDSNIDTLPSWVDAEKLKESQSICLKYYNPISFASGSGAMMFL